ncbi:unnamed protein product [Allacma fusca]|uniref:C2 domain-containing protein n=1 Tax=Allacma fusca TaxID=39272 RepID=A0A8J2L3P5_9HEXA|nr:unnamed protein product [Allacma fusca]
MKIIILAIAAVIALAVEAYPFPQGSSSDSTLNEKNLTFVISGSKIPTQDDYSAIDAFVKVYKVSNSGEKERIGTTSVVQDEEDPEWDNVFWVDWKKGEGQKLELVVRDHDILDTDDEAGEGTLDLDEFVSKNQHGIVPLSKGGELIVKGTQPVQFKLYARNVPHKDKINGESTALGEGQSDVYVKAYWRRGRGGVDHQFASSVVVDNEENPDWPEVFEFGNYQKGTDQYLYFKVKDQDILSKNERIGDLLVEADPLVSSRKKVVSKLENSDGRATLGIVPL